MINTKPARILHIFTILNRGGAETMVMNYYRHIDRTKIQFDFLVHRAEKGDYEDEIQAMGGKIFKIPPIFHMKDHRQEVQLFFNSHSEYQIIHGHVGELGYFIYKEAAKRHLPCIIAHAHNAACDLNWKWPIRTILKHLIRRHVSHPMTCSSDAGQWLFGAVLSKKAVVLNNAIDARLYSLSQRTRSDVRAKMGWENHFIVGDVARFSPPKNHPALLLIFQEILKKQSNALLVLIGSKSELYDSIVSKAKKMKLDGHIQFLGTRTDVPQLMQGMDVYCSPSNYEGLSVSMVEAQAAGLRVITSTNVPREVELIPDSVDFIPLSSPHEYWANRILAPYKQHNTYDEICRAGFDISENAKWLQEFYLKQLMNIIH